jgi:hypothetical protein
MAALKLCTACIQNELVDDNVNGDEQGIDCDTSSEFVSFVERWLASHAPNRVDKTEEFHRPQIDIFTPTIHPNSEPQCWEDRCLCICPIYILWCNTILTSFTSLSTVLIFNFTLALQLGAMEGLKPDQDASQCHAELRRTVRLYAMGTAQLEDKVGHLIRTRLALSTRNIAGHAYALLHETQSTNLHWQDLISFFMRCFNRHGKELVGLGCFLGNAVQKIICAMAA